MKTEVTRQGRSWALREAAKHTTVLSIERRIAKAKEDIRVLSGTSLNGAVEAHEELIRVLSERAKGLTRQQGDPRRADP